MANAGAWLPTVDWSQARTHRYVYFAAGIAESRLGSRGWISVDSRPEAGGGAIEARWIDADDQEVLLTEAHYPAQGDLVENLDLKATGHVFAKADTEAGKLVVSRSRTSHSASSEARFNPAQPFDWRIMWGFRFLMMPWSADRGGPLVLGDVDLSPAAPFMDGCAAVSVQTTESKVPVSTPDGERNVDCWRIEASGPKGQEVAFIGKAGEGLVRFDMNLSNSALLIGIAG